MATIQPHKKVALGSAGTEVPFTIPPNTQQITFQVREGDTDLQYYWVSNANGGGPAGDGNYFTLRQGNARTIVNPWVNGQVIYFVPLVNASRNVEMEFSQ